MEHIWSVQDNSHMDGCLCFKVLNMDEAMFIDRMTMMTMANLISLMDLNICIDLPREDVELNLHHINSHMEDSLSLVYNMMSCFTCRILSTGLQIQF